MLREVKKKRNHILFFSLLRSTTRKQKHQTLNQSLCRVFPPGGQKMSEKECCREILRNEREWQRERRKKPRERHQENGNEIETEGRILTEMEKEKSKLLALGCCGTCSSFLRLILLNCPGQATTTMAVTVGTSCCHHSATEYHTLWWLSHNTHGGVGICCCVEMEFI